MIQNLVGHRGRITIDIVSMKKSKLLLLYQNLNEKRKNDVSFWLNRKKTGFMK